jgi:TnpA family transposase
MASIERTAYPRLKKSYTKAELKSFYTPTLEEKHFVREKTRKDESSLHLLILLKTFRHLGYFPNIENIPEGLIKHLCSSLKLPKGMLPIVNRNTLYQQKLLVLAHQKLKKFDRESRKLIVRALFDAAQVMDNPADLINVAIEHLIKESYELPSFDALDRLVRRIRTLVNQGIFQTILQQLNPEQIQILDQLTELESQAYQTPYNSLKGLPKKATLRHLQELIDHLEWLLALTDFEAILKDVPPAKIKNFYAQAKSLDASEIKDFAPLKRYSLLICLIHRAKIKVRDSITEMFIKRIAKLHQKGKDKLEQIKLGQNKKAERLISIFSDVLQHINLDKPDADIGKSIRLILKNEDVEVLQEECELAIAYSGDNYFPLLLRFFRSHRNILFRLIKILQFSSTSSNRSLMLALDFLLENENKRGIYLMSGVSLDFASEKWRRTIQKTIDGFPLFERNQFEMCVFSYLAQELKSGDIAVVGSELYADYRTQLLTWAECELLIEKFCSEVELPSNATEFVNQLKRELTNKAIKVDTAYPKNSALLIDKHDKLLLTKVKRREPSATSQALESAIVERMPERSLLDILSNVQFYTNWMRHFGPLSGSDPKLERPIERYLLTLFTYGCNLGPAQAARHMRGVVTEHMLSYVNRRHINAKKLDAALVDLLNNYNKFKLPKFWGDGTRASADGTKYELAEQNLMAEYHIRYGGYGGIAYHHVSDLYIALFSHFISCGTWEAVYIIDGLLKNESEIQPDILHADTQGQSTTVFGLSYLLGIKLMPRIRNVKDLVFYRPDKVKKYKHINAIFGDAIDWELIETHWKDLMQVVLSVNAGKVMPSTLLRKLGNYSRNNRVYLAYRELGRVVRTIFLLDYISDPKMREEIHANTNKVEAFNGFAKWINFGGEILQENDPEEQEKLIKFNNLVANALIFQNVIDQTRIIKDLVDDGFNVKAEDLMTLSPYLTSHIKRFGDYVIDLTETPPDLDIEYTFSL